MILVMNSSNIGTVKAVSPRAGLQIMPLAIKFDLVGAEGCYSASKLLSNIA